MKPRRHQNASPDTAFASAAATSARSRRSHRADLQPQILGFRVHGFGVYVGFQGRLQDFGRMKGFVFRVWNFRNSSRLPSRQFNECGGLWSRDVYVSWEFCREYSAGGGAVLRYSARRGRGIGWYERLEQPQLSWTFMMGLDWLDTCHRSRMQAIIVLLCTGW